MLSSGTVKSVLSSGTVKSVLSSGTVKSVLCSGTVQCSEYFVFRNCSEYGPCCFLICRKFPNYGQILCKILLLKNKESILDPTTMA